MPEEQILHLGADYLFSEFDPFYLHSRMGLRWESGLWKCCSSVFKVTGYFCFRSNLEHKNEEEPVFMKQNELTWASSGSALMIFFLN